MPGSSSPAPSSSAAVMDEAVPSANLDADGDWALAASLKSYLSAKVSSMDAVEAKMAEQARKAVSDVGVHAEAIKQKAEDVKRELRENILVRLDYRRKELKGARARIAVVQVRDKGSSHFLS